MPDQYSEHLDHLSLPLIQAQITNNSLKDNRLHILTAFVVYQQDFFIYMNVLTLQESISPCKLPAQNMLSSSRSP